MKLEIQGATKIYGATRALDELTLSLPDARILVLIGPSGCGKSTLLRLVGDLLQPTSGALVVNGKSAHQARLDQDYGMVFQAPVLLEWRSILKNVMLRRCCSNGAAFSRM